MCRSDGRVADGEAARISPHSLFGEGLSETTAYAAVAVALQTLRDRGRRHDEEIHWDVPTILAAYHDPILAASFLRAALPGEVAWAHLDPDWQDTLDEVSFVSGGPGLRQSPILAGELAWASATGMLAERVHTELKERIGGILREHEEVRSLIDAMGDAVLGGATTNGQAE